MRLGRDHDHEPTVRPEDPRELAAVPRREDVEGHIDGVVADRQRPPEIEHHARRSGECAEAHANRVGRPIREEERRGRECASDRCRVVAGSAPQVGDPRRRTGCVRGDRGRRLGDGLGDGGVGAAFEQRGTRREHRAIVADRSWRARRQQREVALLGAVEAVPGRAAEDALIDRREVQQTVRAPEPCRVDRHGTGARIRERSAQWWLECDASSSPLVTGAMRSSKNHRDSHRAHALPDGDLAPRVRTDHQRLVVSKLDEPPALVLVERLVHLDVLAAGEPHDATRLVAVQHDLAVLLLERDADALGDEVGDERAEDHHGLQGVDHALHRELEVRRDDVGARRRPEDGVERDTGGTDRGAGRRVARTVGDVVLALVARDPRLDERVERPRGR